MSKPPLVWHYSVPSEPMEILVFIPDFTLRMQGEIWDKHGISKQYLLILPAHI